MVVIKFYTLTRRHLEADLEEILVIQSLLVSKGHLLTRVVTLEFSSNQEVFD